MTVHSKQALRRARVASAVPVVVALSGIPAFATAASAAAPTVPVAAVTNQTLVITGTKGPDNITVGVGAGTLVVDLGTGSTQTFDRSTFTAVSVTLDAGDDTFVEQQGNSSPPVTLDAGSGNDNIQTGDGPDSLLGGSGNDVLNAGFGDDVVHGGGGADTITGSRGNDTVFGDAGNDVIAWAPGDGSDVVDGGGGGRDDVQFSGANINETMTLTAAGAHTLFTRDIASIQLDLVNVEQFDLSTFGGSDTITVGDLTGTKLHAVDLDLGVFGGGSDAQVDTIVVNGTPNADRVGIAAPGAAVAVSGLPAKIAVANADPTDQLHIATLAGKDRVTVDSTALGRITMSADLGTDQI